MSLRYVVQNKQTGRYSRCQRWVDDLQQADIFTKAGCLYFHADVRWVKVDVTLNRQVGEKR